MPWVWTLSRGYGRFGLVQEARAAMVYSQESENGLRTEIRHGCAYLMQTMGIQWDGTFASYAHIG